MRKFEILFFIYYFLRVASLESSKKRRVKTDFTRQNGGVIPSNKYPLNKIMATVEVTVLELNPVESWN